MFNRHMAWVVVEALSIIYPPWLMNHPVIKKLENMNNKLF